MAARCRRLGALCILFAAALRAAPSPCTADVHLSIALQPARPDRLATTLGAISDPASPRYGQHLTRGQAQALLMPRPESAAAVKRWLADAGVPEHRVQHRGQLIDARVAAEQAQRLLLLLPCLSARGGEPEPSALLAAVPRALRGHVAAMERTVAFRHARSWRASRVTNRSDARPADDDDDDDDDAQHAAPVHLDACKEQTTPACLRNLYHMGDEYAKPHNMSLLGIAGFNRQAAQHDQLDKFLHAVARYAVGANFSTELVNGGQNPQGEFPGGEANLDIQYAVAMAYKVPVRFYSTGGANHDFVPDLDIPDPNAMSIEPWLPFLSHLLHLDDDQLPRVLSISYGVNEQAVPRAYAHQVCAMFGQLGTRGVSVVVASGDAGPGLSCQANDGTNATRFLPSFPASCPYVTAVGATGSFAPEVALDFSSGGFSRYWPRPPWQDAAVARYLDAGYADAWAAYYDARGRAFPDVAAQGKAFPIVSHDRMGLASGTSASAPLFASIVALLNDARFHRGQPAMGFLNPWLYTIGRHGLVDITAGRSHGCAGASYTGAPAPRIPGAGWDAVPGWDPVTGLGTPLLHRLRDLACN